MAIGTIAAIAIASSAAASAYAAHEQSSAAKDAAKIQADAANKATALQGDIYGQQKAALNPYTQAGQGAIDTLSRLLGAPAGSQYASPGNTGALMQPFSAPPPGAGVPPPGATPYPGPTPMGPPPGAGPGPGAMPPPMGVPRPAPSFPSGGPMRSALSSPMPQYDGMSPLNINDFIARPVA